MNPNSNGLPLKYGLPLIIVAVLVIWNGFLLQGHGLPAATTTIAPATVIFGALAIAGLAWLYFLPTTIARRRGHPSQGAIFLMNLLTAWLVLPWFFQIIWALSGPGTDHPMPTRTA